MGSCVGTEGLNLEGLGPDINDPAIIEEVLLIKSQEERDANFVELWHACAGPMVNIPYTGELVFYFPQGHLEQIEAYTKQETICQMPVYDLPSKILCKVLYVQLKVEADTDEVFAQVTLLPVKEEDLTVLKGKSKVQSPRRDTVQYFSKVLTPSDTSTHGGFSILRRHAIECLPPLDPTQQPPAQELEARDLHGGEWHFRHIYRGQPKRHLLTSGWSTYVSAKRLVPGDSFVFLRGEDGEFRVGLSRGTKLQTNISESIMSCHSMQLGILATASHALSTGSMFSVFYRPRTSPSEFLISCDEYFKSLKCNFTFGMRFRMKSQGEENPEDRLAGIIVGIQDIDPLRWPDSEWKSLVVKWDQPFAKILSPGRVSSWSIEPLEITSNMKSVHSRAKRPRNNPPLLVGSSSASSKHGSSSSSVEPIPPSPPEPQLPPQGHSGVLQGQEISTIGAQEARVEIGDWVPSPKSNLLESQLHFQLNNPVTQNPGNIASSSRTPPDEFGLDSYLLPSFSAYLNSDDAAFNENLSIPNANSYSTGFQEWNDPDPNKTVLTQINQPKKNGTCMLFGVNLGKRPLEPPPASVIISSEFPKTFSVADKLGSQSGISDSNRLSEQSKTKNMSYSSGNGGAFENQCKNCCNTTQSCTKVHKYGTALGRSVDLMKFNSYTELLVELDQMFAFEGGLVEMSNDWNVIYTDEEGDIMLLGDSPWVEFRAVVRKLFIFPKDQIEKLNQSTWVLKPSSPTPNLVSICTSFP